MALLLGLSANSWARFADGSAAGGTVITNQAQATYRDDSGFTYDAVSQIVTITVLAVASVAVSPDEATPSETVAPHDRVTRLFRICNTGNTADTFTLTNSSITAPATVFALYFDNDSSGTFSNGDTPIVVNQTATPTLAAGACIGVRFGSWQARGGEQGRYGGKEAQAHGPRKLATSRRRDSRHLEALGVASGIALNPIRPRMLILLPGVLPPAAARGHAQGPRAPALSHLRGIGGGGLRGGARADGARRR